MTVIPPLENRPETAMSVAAKLSTGNFKDLYEIGEMPPLGYVPAQMHAWLIRPERFGKPTEAFQKEVVPPPTIPDDEALV